MSFHSKIPENAERLEEYRRCVASFEMPIQNIDEMIDIVHSILSYFVDQAFNVQTDQITLQSIKPDIQNSSAQRDHVGKDSNPTGKSEP